MPKTKKQMQAFLGLTGHYREYIPGYSGIAVPLTDATKKREPNKVRASESVKEAFENLKKALISRPILKLPKLNEPFILRTDASHGAIGAVLMQRHDDKLLPVSFASRKLCDREINYGITEKECLAIVWSFKKY